MVQKTFNCPYFVAYFPIVLYFYMPLWILQSIISSPLLLSLCNKALLLRAVLKRVPTFEGTFLTLWVPIYLSCHKQWLWKGPQLPCFPDPFPRCCHCKGECPCSWGGWCRRCPRRYGTGRPHDCQWCPGSWCKNPPLTEEAKAELTEKSKYYPLFNHFWTIQRAYHVALTLFVAIISSIVQFSMCSKGILSLDHCTKNL